MKERTCYVIKASELKPLTIKQKMAFGRFYEEYEVQEISHQDGTFSMLFEYPEPIRREKLIALLPYLNVIDIASNPVVRANIMRANS